VRWSDELKWRAARFVRGVAEVDWDMVAFLRVIPKVEVTFGQRRASTRRHPVVSGRMADFTLAGAG